MPVTTQDIKDLMVISTDPADLTLHLETATLIVTEDLSDKGYSADRIEKLTLFLAAHFAVLGLERGGLSRKDVGESAESYRTISPADRGYQQTRFGQAAMALDTSGTLAEQSKATLKAEFRVV